MLRTFRVLRVGRLLKSLSSFQLIINVIGNSISAFAYLALLLIIFIFIYSLFGMTIFGGTFQSWKETPRPNFDSFFNSFISVFDILTV